MCSPEHDTMPCAMQRGQVIAMQEWRGHHPYSLRMLYCSWHDDAAVQVGLCGCTCRPPWLLSPVYQVPATVPQGRAIKPYLPTIKPPKAPTLAPSCLPTLPMHRHAAISTAAPHMCASTDNEAPRSQYASSNAGTNPGARL